MIVELPMKSIAQAPMHCCNPNAWHLALYDATTLKHAMQDLTKTADISTPLPNDIIAIQSKSQAHSPPPTLLLSLNQLWAPSHAKSATTMAKTARKHIEIIQMRIVLRLRCASSQESLYHPSKVSIMINLAVSFP